MPYADPEKRKSFMREYYRRNKEDRREYARRYHATHKSEAAEKQAARRAAGRKFLLDFLSIHPCRDCGEDDPVVLEFDHVRGKTANIGDLVTYSLERIRKEIELCEVRCANCHKRRHHREKNRSARVCP